MAPTSNSIRRAAAKPIISRNKSASGVFSTSARRFIISSVIGGSSNQVGVATRPYRRITGDHREAARSLQRYRGALPSGFATAELHHHLGRDPIPSADKIPDDCL